MNAEEQLITKLRAKLRESEEALYEVSSVLYRIVSDVTRHTVTFRAMFPKAAAMEQWFYDQKEYDGPCEDKIL
jgi:hypothetical protein